jgi:hypothetical protein
MTDEEIILKHDRGVRQRARMELKIVNQLINSAASLGYSIEVAEADEEEDKGKSIKDILFNLDEANVRVFRADGSKLGWIFLVFGNSGYDLISDYTYSHDMEKFLGECCALSDRLADGLE